MARTLVPSALLVPLWRSIHMLARPAHFVGFCSLLGFALFVGCTVTTTEDDGDDGYGGYGGESTTKTTTTTSTTSSGTGGGVGAGGGSGGSSGCVGHTATGKLVKADCDDGSKMPIAAAQNCPPSSNTEPLGLPVCRRAYD